MFRRLCPKCGEVYDKLEFAKVHLGPGVYANMMCVNNHKWTEFYTLTYTGYWWDGKRYNSYGEEQSNDVC